MPLFTPLRNTQLLPGTLQNLFYPPRDYSYFKRAAEVPFSRAETISKAAWAADASMLAYARYGSRRMTDAELDENFQRGGLHYEKIGGTGVDWNAPGTQAVFAWCDTFAILAFRGTERDDPRDLYSDLDIVLVHEPDYRPSAGDPEPALGFLAHVGHLFTAPCMVHRGFSRALGQVWERVHSLVTDYRLRHPGAEICFTGHSLGAALALLAFSRFADSNLSLYTFGCPRVGDGAFCDRASSSPGKGMFRFVNFDDAVTHIPLESFAYRHAPGQGLKIASDGSIDADDGAFRGDLLALQAAVTGLPFTMKTDLDVIEAPPSVVDHSPGRYCYRLWDCV